MDMQNDPMADPGEPKFLERITSSLRRKVQHWLDRSTVYLKGRWFGFFTLMFMYVLRVYLIKGFHIISYGLGIYLLNLFIGFLSPLVSRAKDRFGVSHRLLFDENAPTAAETGRLRGGREPFKTKGGGRRGPLPSFHDRTTKLHGSHQRRPRKPFCFCFSRRRTLQWLVCTRTLVGFYSNRLLTRFAILCFVFSCLPPPQHLARPTRHQDDEELDGPDALPTSSRDEFQPFIRRVPEFQFWWSASKATFFAFCLTFFRVLDVPVFWPILLVYFCALFFLTMKRQIDHMYKHKYVPWSWGKTKYKGKEEGADAGGAGKGRAD